MPRPHRCLSRTARSVLLAALLLASVTSCNGAKKPAAETKLSYHGVETQAPQPSRPEFVLTDTSGKRYDFQQETAGRPTYVYFGYTHCPDECPTAMSDVATALRKAAKDQAEKAVVVFVTTDPKRDTARVLRRFLDQFSPKIVGLLGTQAELDAAQTAAGVKLASVGPPIPTVPGHPDRHLTEAGTAPHKHFGDPLGYSVTHSAVIFAYNADDRLPVLYPGGVTPSDIADDLPLLLDPRRAAS